MRNGLILLIMMVMGISCRESVDLRQLEHYTGPFRVTEDMEVFRSDSAVVRVKLTAPKQLVFANQDMEFPEGIQIYFYDEEGKLTSTIRANKAYYEYKERLYKGEGDVRVHNVEEGTKLNSEELYWNERKELITTEKFVTVEESDGTVIYATGMEANQDLTDYTFKKIENSLVRLPGEE